jgi:hypothetical protein
MNILLEHIKKVFRYEYFQTGKLHQSVPVKKKSSVPIQFWNLLSLFLSTTPEHFFFWNGKIDFFLQFYFIYMRVY